MQQARNQAERKRKRHLVAFQALYASTSNGRLLVRHALELISRRRRGLRRLEAPGELHPRRARGGRHGRRGGLGGTLGRKAAPAVLKG